MNAFVFKQLLVNSIWPGLSDQVQDLLVEFLQGIGEVSNTNLLPQLLPMVPVFQDLCH